MITRRSFVHGLAGAGGVGSGGGALAATRQALSAPFPGGELLQGAAVALVHVEGALGGPASDARESMELVSSWGIEDVTLVATAAEGTTTTARVRATIVAGRV